jgi:hypothetical protein
VAAEEVPLEAGLAGAEDERAGEHAGGLEALAVAERLDQVLHHEAQGGHTLLKHIGRDEDFLARRQLIDSPKGSTWVTPVSSFATLGEAQELITTALRVHAAEISAWLAQGTRSQLDIALPLAAPVGVVLDASRRLGTAHYVVVRLGRTKGGDVLVRTAMLAP